MENNYPPIESVYFPHRPTLTDAYGYARAGHPVVTDFDDQGNIVSCRYEAPALMESVPSEEEIQHCFKMLLEQYEKVAHYVPRQQAYPSVGDQLDALYHAGVFPPEMEEKIRAVKEQFPKQTSDNL